MSDWLTEYFRPTSKRDSVPSTPARTDLSRVVPVPASSTEAPAPRSEPRPSFSRDVENLSIGLGRGLTSQLEGLKTLVTEPRQVYEGLKQFAGQVIDDPRVLAQMAEEYGIKATSGPLGFGEVAGEFLSPGPRLPSAPPVAQIVKPKGNLNLAPAIRAEALKGPEKQTLESFRSQAAKLPGVTKGGFEENVLPLLRRNYVRSTTGASSIPASEVISKSEFEREFVPPSEYGKVDLKSGASDAYQHYLDEAAETLSNNYEDVVRATMERLGLDYDNQRAYDQYREFFNGSMNVDQSFMEAMRRHGVRNPHQLQGLEDEVFGELATIHARDMLDEDFGGRIGEYTYGSYQRLMATPSADDPGYFEVGVTHPSAEVGRYRHYSESPDPLIGHIRGTHLKPGMPEESYEVVHDWAGGKSSRGILDIFKAKPNSVIIEELQSDVQKGDFEQKGALRQVHGTLFKAAVQDALERGADTVYMPTSVPIAAVRGTMPTKYSSIYDQQVVKEGLNPLKKIPGVSVNPIEHNGKVTYFEISFTPEAKDYILKGPGQLAPGYADGGAVETDYTKYNDRILRALIKRYGSEAKAREVMRTTDGGELLRIMLEEESRMADGGSVDAERKRVENEIRKLPWFRNYVRKFGEEPNLSATADYDYFTAFKSGALPDESDHWPSYTPDGKTRLKREGHPTLWKTFFMDQTGINPDAIGLKSEQQAQEWLKRNPIRKADGGSVEEEDYDERAIEEIVAPLRQRLEQFTGEARKVPRRLKQAAADVTEIGPIIKRSNEIPLKYFEMSGEAGGEADAMRHLLFQAQLAKKYGEGPAKAISYLHEYTTFGQPESQREMDLYNDILGREIAAKAKNGEDLERLAEKYVKTGRAKVLPKEQRGGY